MGKIKNSQYVFFIVAILLISFIVNVFLSVDNGKYKDRVSKKSSDELEMVVHGNETIKNILLNSIKSRSILKSDLLKLDSQYNQVYLGIWSLMDDYAYYKDSKVFSFKKESDIKCDVSDDTVNKIKLYVDKVVERSINTNEEKIELRGNDLLNFEKMNEFASKLDGYFQVTINKNSTDGTFEGLQKNIRDKNLWVDVLDNIFDISNKYSSIEFKN